MGIKEGMRIVDIGAGTGLFTFAFADAVGAGGKVFATDVLPEMLEVIRSKAGEGKYENVFPVLLEEKGGVDAFYKKREFDVIFLSSVYECLDNPDEYFKELLPSLSKKGRLYIVYHNVD